MEKIWSGLDAAKTGVSLVLLVSLVPLVSLVILVSLLTGSVKEGGTNPSDLGGPWKP